MGADVPAALLGVPGVSVAVTARGHLDDARGFGLLATDATEGVDVGVGSMFHAASMSKLVTALGVLRLASQGSLDLDRDVNDLLRSWTLVPATGRVMRAPVTLRTLLSHQGGIVDPEGAFEVVRPTDTPPTLPDLLSGRTPFNPRPVRVEHAPGSRFLYSDAGYCVVEQLLTDVTRTPFADLMGELVLGPLGMTRSSFASVVGSAVDGSHETDVATGHDQHGAVVDGRYPVYPAAAAAGLWSTPTDLSRALVEIHHALTGGGALGLTPDLAHDMVRGQASTPWAGLGCFVGGTDTGVRLTSLGWGVGFQCALRSYPHTGDAVVVMTNCDPGRPQDEALTGHLLRGIEEARGWSAP